MKFVVIFILLIFSVILCQKLDSRASYGYPRGFMSVCPGSTKTAKIPRSQLKFLYFLVQGNGRTRHRYSYWSGHKIANDSRIDFKRKTLLIAVGYLDNPSFPIGTLFANEYEARGYNIILIDNHRFATVHYHLAARMMRPVGQHVAEVLSQLTEAGLDPSKTELLGFSLGGQTISYIGKYYQKFTGRKLSKITALEPSGPCFRLLSPNDRLSPSDAEFVEVIHTNIDGFGMATPMGHVDFYVNGGEFQPSDITVFPCMATCSHFQSLILWQSALNNPKKFIAIKCNSVQEARDSDCYKNVPLITNYLGLNVNSSVEKHGIYYLSTEKYYPYYLGENGLKLDYVYWKRITHVNDPDHIEIFT